jgi:hypothetical protein
MQKHMLALQVKTMQYFILLVITTCLFFYLWLFCVNFNMFVLMVKLINDCWVF